MSARVAVPAFFALFLIALPSPPALAQRETDIGSEEQRLRRPRPTEVPDRQAIPIEIPAEEPLPPSAGLAQRVRVERVAIEGSSLMPERELARLARPVVGKEATLQEIQQVARAVTRWYRGRGYVTSRAVVPAQEVVGGTVVIRVVESRIGQIRIEGNRYFSTELLRRQITAEPGDRLRLAELERGLARLNAHPDRKVKMVLAPGSEPETTDVLLQVTDRRPAHASYAIDSLGSKTTGLWRHSVSVSHGNLTGRDDQLSLRGIITEFGGLGGGAGSYLLPLTRSGITGTFDVSGVKSSIGEDLKGLRASGEAFTVSPGLVVPCIRRTGLELEAVLGFDYRHIRTELDAVTNSKDDLRVPHVGMNLLEQDLFGQSLFTQELRVGVGNFLGGSHGEDPAASRAKAGGSFVHWNTAFVRLQRTVFGLQLLLRGSSQLSADRLVPAEQFRLGGFDSVRGYPEGEYLADSGYQATVELRTPLERLLPVWGGDNSLLGRVRRSLLVVGFWDYGEGFLKDPLAGEDADMRLMGVGCGFRLRPTAESTLQADWGWAIGDSDSEKDRPRLHLICRIGF